jgi:hypothetical protein
VIPAWNCRVEVDFYLEKAEVIASMRVILNGYYIYLIHNSIHKQPVP